MMLRFKDLSNLKTKRIVFEDVFKAGNCAITLELLKELTAKRRLIDDSFNRSNSITDAVAREMSGGLTYRREQELYKLDEYLPLLESLVHHVDSMSNEPRINEWVSRLKIQWTSVLSTSCLIKKNVKPSFYQISCLQYERGMTLFLYGSIIRERALEEPLDDLVQSVTLLRRAAGVFEYQASYILPLLPLTQSRPAEVIPSLSTALSLVCLAEAQAISIMRAQQRATTSSLLAKLNLGVAELFDQARVALEAGCKVSKDVTSQFLEFVSCCKGLYELRGYSSFAESFKEAEEFGNAIGLLNLAVKKAKKEGSKESTWKSILRKEVSKITDTRKKYEHENNFLNQEKLPLEHELPLPESARIVQLIAYQPQRVQLEKDLCFVMT